MKTNLVFLLRLIVAWLVVFLVTSIFWNTITNGKLYFLEFTLVSAGFIWLIILITQIATHIRRVRLIVGDANTNRSTLGNRHRRQIEIPMLADEAFRMIDTAVREFRA